MTTVTALPTPPSSSDPSNFDSRADAFLVALPTFGTQLNLVAGEVNANASSASSSATNAAASALTSATNANFKGTWTSLGSSNVTLPSSVSHSGKFWQALQAYTNASTQTPGSAPTYWQEIILSIPQYTYANRNSLRTLSASQCLVEGLGFFVYYAGSTEIDDDETCFATASGRWLLEAVGPEFVLLQANQIQEPLEALETKVEELEQQVNGSFLFASINPGITSLTTLATNTFDVRVTGAQIGDAVVVTPPTDTDFRELVIHSAVSAAHNVKVHVFNASSATETYMDLPWSIVVIRRF